MDGNLRSCTRCHVPYIWHRSSSRSLKMTYCSTSCEKGDLGCTIENIIDDMYRVIPFTHTAYEPLDNLPDPILIPGPEPGQTKAAPAAGDGAASDLNQAIWDYLGYGPLDD